MLRTIELHRALHALMKRQRRTLRDAAEVLAISEASARRLFSQGKLSLERVYVLCDWLQVDLAEVVAASESRRAPLTELTIEQERALVADASLLLVLQVTVNHWPKNEVLAIYNFTEAEYFQKLVQLEKLQMVEILPFDRVKPRTARNFSWRANGPVQQLIRERILPEFLATDFTKPGEKQLFVNGMLSRESVLKVLEQLDRLGVLFNELVELDKHRPMTERYGVSLLAGMRPWEVSLFSQYRRAPNDKQFK